MAIFPSPFIFDVGLTTSFTTPTGIGAVSINRLPTDVIYYADLDYINFNNSTVYKTTYDDNQNLISSGTINGALTVGQVGANSVPEVIVTKTRLYGYDEYISTVAHSRSGTVIYGAQTIDSNITDSLVTVQAYVGYSYDGVAKTLTISNNATINNAYDFGSYSAALLANIDYEYPLSTAIGVNYIMPTGWLLITGNGLNNVNLTGDMRIDSISNLTGLNLTGTLTFTAAGTYTIADSTITNVANTSAGNVVINASGSTSITNNLNPATITIQASASLTLTDMEVGSDVVILQAGTNNVLDSFDQITGTTYTYNYTAVQNVDIGVIKQGFVPLYLYNFALTGINASLPRKLTPDRTYQ